MQRILAQLAMNAAARHDEQAITYRTSFWRMSDKIAAMQARARARTTGAQVRRNDEIRAMRAKRDLIHREGGRLDALTRKYRAKAAAHLAAAPRSRSTRHRV